MSDAYIGLIYLASAKNFLYDKNGMQRQQTVTRISLNISQGQKKRSILKLMLLYLLSFR